MSTAPPEGVDLLSSPARRAIVDYIANLASQPEAGTDPRPARQSGLTAARLAEVLNLHVTTTRFHLDQLVNGRILEATFVKEGVGRPRKIYRLAQRALNEPADTHAMRMLTHLLADSFGATADGEPLTPVQAGRRWAEEHVSAADTAPSATPGAWLAKVGRLIDVLREWGYTPQLSTGDGGRAVELQLVDCPFLDLARSHPAVVCGIHRGLITGTMEQLGEHNADVSLEPFVGPRHCVARITTRRTFSAIPQPIPDSAPPTRTPSKETA